MVKNPPAKAGDIRDAGSIPGLGRSPGGGHGNPRQYSCLENPMEGEPGGLQSTGLQRVGHDRGDLAHFPNKSTGHLHICFTRIPSNSGGLRGHLRAREKSRYPTSTLHPSYCGAHRLCAKAPDSQLDPGSGLLYGSQRIPGSASFPCMYSRSDNSRPLAAGIANDIMEGKAL